MNPCTVGFSFRALIGDTVVSVGWLLPPGRGWQGSNDLSLGYRGDSTDNVPDEAADILRGYAGKVSGISGSRPIGGDTVRGCRLSPEAVVDAEKEKGAAIADGHPFLLAVCPRCCPLMPNVRALEGIEHRFSCGRCAK